MRPDVDAIGPTIELLVDVVTEATGVRGDARQQEDPATEEVSAAFLPYFRVRTRFDPGAGAALAAPIPPLEDYFPALMDHARAACWGKRTVARWERAVSRA